MNHTDIFATKGIEYLIVIGFLALLIVYWRFVAADADPRDSKPPVRRHGRFVIQPGYWFHPGHTWAAPLASGRVRVGMDDFAQKLLGRLADIDLPKVGQRVGQGELGWTARVGDREVRMLSPIDGVVEAVNREVVDSAGLVNDDPYDRGWLLEVRPTDDPANRRNLMEDRLAGLWMEDWGERLGSMWAGRLGTVLPDGGAPVQGFGSVISPEDWDSLAERLFLTDELPS